MGLAVRIIPTILCRGRQQVKGMKFNSWRSVGLAAQAVRVHQKRGVDEVVLLDVRATPEGRGPDLGLVEELAEEMFAPMAVGGGVKNVNDVRRLLQAGADKVVIGTAAWTTNVVREAAEFFGSQAIVAAIDVKDGDVRVECNRSTACTAGSDAVPPVIYAKQLAQRGAGEILLTSIDREGTMEGYDLDLIREVSHAVDVPVIAHGGCKSYEDMVDAIYAGASAVAAGALFQFTDATPRGAAKALAEYGIEVRQ